MTKQAKANSKTSAAPAEAYAVALALQQQGRTAEAEKAYRSLLAELPGHADAWNNLGVLLNTAGRQEEALACFDRLAAIEPAQARAHCNRGVALKQLGRISEAVVAHGRALELDPKFHAAHNNLGNLFFTLGKHSEAAGHFGRACGFAPAHADYRFMHGKALLECGQINAAETELLAAIALDPSHADAWGTLARLWSERHHMPEALACFERGNQARPDYPGLLYNRGLARLLAGDLPGGWADYEYRWQVPDFPSKRLPVKQPLWNGAPLTDKTLLLHAEQGLGDTLQFLRYLPAAARRAHHVFLLVQAPLTSLLQLPANVTLLREGQPYPAFDVVCPLLSLPRLFNTDILSIPATVPYLNPDRDRCAAWAQRLAGNGLRIGIVWAGNPSHSNDANRSMDIALLNPLFAMENIRFFSLQVGPRSADISALGLTERIVDLGPELKDFGDTAAALGNLDLLLCVDTSVAHLAGALGIPVWLMLPFMPDWRWLLDREDSPWYPSLRIFRQTSQRDWPGVVARVARELKEIIPGSAASRRRLASADFQVETGRTLLERREFESAATHFWHALRTHPLCPRAFSGLAVIAYRNSQFQNAVSLGQRACSINPKDPENWSNCGAYLKAAKDLPRALACQEKAIGFAPRNAAIHSNIANTLGAMHRWEDALPHAKRAIALEPKSPDFHYNLGIALKELALFDEARDAFRKAQKLAHGHVKAALHEALIDLLQGHLKRGWTGYETRWLQPDCKEIRSFTRPLWKGEPLAGKRLLVHAEQGFGDTLQFLRYLSLIERAGAQAILVVQPDLETIATRMPGNHVLVKSGAPLPDFDYHCPLLSLPGAFGTTLKSIPATVPYIEADPAHLEHWRERLSGLKNRRVALVWAGRPTHANDSNRSMPLHMLAPLLENRNVDCIALQKGEATKQIDTLPASCRILNLSEELTSFEDTAAILELADVLVTVDTSVAHLAGALGRPVKLFLPLIPDWRWLLDRADSPWYPTMSLYRQTRRGDWSEPVANALRDLDPKAASR